MQNHYQAATFPASNPPHRIPPAVREHLQERLLALPFAEFADLIARLLGRMGYTDIQVMGAMHERGRNLHGGYDLSAQATTGLHRSLVLIQVKQYQRDVPRAFVDELRGALVRLNAQQGVIVSTGAFSPAARDAAQAGQHSLPLRLVGGSELVRLLLEQEVVPEPTVVPEPMAGSGAHTAHDTAQDTNQVSPGKEPARSDALQTPLAGRRVTITVQLAPSPRGMETPPAPRAQTLPR